MVFGGPIDFHLRAKGQRLDYCENCKFSQIRQACANCTNFAEWCHHGDLLEVQTFSSIASVVFNRHDRRQADLIFKVNACKS